MSRKKARVKRIIRNGQLSPIRRWTGSQACAKAAVRLQDSEPMTSALVLMARGRRTSLASSMSWWSTRFVSSSVISERLFVGNRSSQFGKACQYALPNREGMSRMTSLGSLMSSTSLTFSMLEIGMEAACLLERYSIWHVPCWSPTVYVTVLTIFCMVWTLMFSSSSSAQSCFWPRNSSMVMNPSLLTSRKLNSSTVLVA
mmetsp:Transcript_70250/g.198276  ORF Transcript_70250/g.198276 Transcript_70250/m.198276 type:complete len:200 (-) Transcript_70250:565-1164(-)